MASDSYRILVQARSWSKRLREKGYTWDQIAEVFALTHEVSPLRLYRLAHGRTATDVIAMVSDADPAGTATLRESRLYEHEAWPQSGRRPPARLLATLAEIYQTASRKLLSAEVMATYDATDRTLISDADFCHLDANQPARRDRDNRVTPQTDAELPSSGKTAWDASACVQLLRAIDVEETDVKRRELLFELALGLGGSQALNVLRVLTAEEEERLAGVLRSTWRMDEATVRTFEKMTLHVRRADDVSGPAALLPVVNGQRAAVGKILARESMGPGLRDRLLDTYAQWSQLVGYLTYDLLDYAAAEQPLRDSLRVALDLGDPTLIAYVHYWLGRMATDQNRTAAVFDHAFAIQSWATRSPSKLLCPLYQSLFALAYAAEGDALASARAHDSALASAGAPKDNEPAYLYWISPSVMESRRATLLVRLNQPKDAVKAAEGFLAEHDARFRRRHGFVLARYAGALALAKEIPEAATRLTEAAVITRQHSSARLAEEITQARTRLQPWADTTYVRRLDETLRSCGLS